MTGDLKTGYLLRAKPRVKFIAQLCGAVVAIFLNVGLYILFTTASPCIMFVSFFFICERSWADLRYLTQVPSCFW